MTLVDALRRVVTNDQDTDLSVNAELTQRLDVFVTMIAKNKIRFMQQADSTSKNLIQLIKDDEKLTIHEARTMENHEIRDELLYRIYGERSLLVILKLMRKGIVIATYG